MRLKLCLLLVFIISYSWGQSGTTKTFNSSGTFPVPAGVTTIIVQAWGGGGSGGGASGAPLLFGRGAAGGGGGAYATAPLSVTPGANLNVVVAGQTSGSTTAGTTGGNSTITGFESTILAAGGSGGAANNSGGNPIGGSGGTTAASAGITKFAGANGGNGNSWNLLGLLLSSGAGGNGANSAGAGGAAVSGLIFSNAPGNGGSIAGGAGSGAINSALGASQIGGSGAAGRVIISYTCPSYSITSTSGTGVCASAGSTSAITLTAGASSLPVGNYVVTYNRSNPSATALTANLTVTTAGTGVFTAVGLTTAGSSTITVTKIASETCSSNISTNNTATVIVSPATVDGTVNGGTTINAGNTSGLLTLSGHTGSIVKWQSSVSPFTTWVDIANTNTTYTSGALTATTQFRAVVQSGTCAVVNSVATTVTVEDLPTITLSAAADPVCAILIEQATSLSYSATTGSPVSYSIVWNSSPPNNFSPITNAVLSASPITIVVPYDTDAGTYTGTLTVKNANGGVSSPGSVFTVTIYESPLIGIGGPITSVCNSSNSQNTTLTYTYVTGNPTSYSIDWSIDQNNTTLLNQGDTPFAFAPGGGVINTIVISPNALPGTYIGLINLSNGLCHWSDTVSITILPSTVGGTVNGGTTIITGNTSGLLTLSGHTGSVVKWQSSVSPFTTWVDIANTNTTYTSGILTETTQFRAVVQSSSCPAANSVATTVTVEDLPTISGLSADNICEIFETDTELYYDGTTGSPVTYSIVWDASPANSFAAITNEELPGSPITIDIPSGTAAGTYTGTLTVKNANGGVSSPGSIFTVTVDPSPVITTSGILTSLCTSTNSQNATLEYSAITGNPSEYFIYWGSEANNGALPNQNDTSFTSVPGGGVINTIEIPANVPPGTYTGTLYLSSGICAIGKPITITILPATVGGTVTGGTTIITGNTSGLLTLSGHTGSVVKWQSSVSPFTTWVDIANTNTTYTSGILTETTQFRAVVQSGTCAVVNSESTTVTVENLPTITIANTPNVCVLSFNQTAELLYSETTGSPVTYSIVWNSSPANTFEAVIDQELLSNYIIIFIPQGTAVGTYTGTLTVKDADGAVSVGSIFNIIVNPITTVTTTGILSPVCVSDTSQFSNLNYSAASGNPITYFIHWDNRINVALLPDVPPTPFNFNSNGGVLPIEVSANALPGNYQGIIFIDSEFCQNFYNISLIVSPATIGGTITGGTTITYGNTSGLLTLSGHTGSVVKWQFSVSPFTTWVDIANTNTTYTSGILTETTQFRAVVQSGTCAVVNSEPTTVTVEELPTITLSNQTNSVCSSDVEQNTALSYSETTGSPVSYSIVWDASPTNAFTAVTDAALPASPITITVPAGTEAGNYTGTLTVKNANGGVSVGSNFNLIVYESPTITTDGIVGTTCATNESQFSYLEYSDSTGTPTSYSINWDDTANAALLVDVPQTSFEFEPGGGGLSIQIPANVLEGTYSGTFVVNNEFCSTSYPITLKIIPGAVGGTVTGGTTIGTGNTSGLLTLSGQTGTVLRWESSVSPFTEWTEIENTETTYTSGPLTETTQFRAIIRKGICPFATSEPTTVTIGILPTITAAASAGNVCYSSNIETAGLSYEVVTGSPVTYSIVWDANNYNFVNVTDEALPASTITIYVPAETFIGTYTGTLTVKDANGIVSSSSSFNVVVNNTPSIYINSEINSVCVSTNSQTSLLHYADPYENLTGYSINWNDTANAAFLADVPFTSYTFQKFEPADMPIEISANALAGVYSGTITFYNEHCSTAYNIGITIKETPTVTTSGIVFKSCSSNILQNSLLKYSAYSGNPVRYAIDWDAAANTALLEDEPDTTFDFEAGEGYLPIKVPANVPEGTYSGTLLISNNDTCTKSYPISIVIEPGVNHGYVYGDSTITSGSTSGLLELSGTSVPGYIWQSSVTPFTTWTDIPNTENTDTYTSGPLTETTQFRVIVESGGCKFHSDPATVTVTEEAPTIQLAAFADVCWNENPQTTVITYEEVTGAPVTYSIVWNHEDFITIEDVTDAPLPASPITIAIPGNTDITTYTGTLTVKNANGTVSSGSTFNLVVHGAAGVFVYEYVNSVCSSSNSQFSDLDYTGYSGDPISYSIDWEDTANAAFLADIPVTPYTFNPDGGRINVPISANALPGRYSGIVTIHTQFCSLISREVVINIDQGTIGGTVTGGTTISSGNTSGLLTLSGHTGSVNKWQSSVSPFTTWTDINNTNTTYTSGPLTETTQFRVVVKEEFCPANSEPTTVTVIEEAPTITLTSSAISDCSFPNGSPNLLSLPYSQTTGNPTTYSIVWDLNPASTLVAVTDAVLPESPIRVNVPTDTAAGTYTGTLTVKNANGTVSSPGLSFTVTKKETAKITTTGAINAVCESTNSQNATLEYSAVTANPTRYSITWFSNLIPSQIGTDYVFNSGGGIIDNIVIPANLPAGTYTGTLNVFKETEGCGQNEFISIVINPPTPAPIVSSITPATDESLGGVNFDGFPELSWSLLLNSGEVEYSGFGSGTSIGDLQAGTYTFSVASETGCYSEPIEVVIPVEASRGIASKELTSPENQISITSLNKVINIETQEQKINDVLIFDVSGTLLYKKERVRDSKLTINNLRSSNQVLVVKVVLDNKQTETKKVIF